MSNLCEAPAVTASYRLLGHPRDLAGHIRSLGPLPIGLEAAWGDSLVAVLDASGLRGRGGAGFATSVKLRAARAHGTGGVMVVNGMESEPASDKDKLLLTRVPHLVLDGAQLLAAANGADRIVVCLPAGHEGVAREVQSAIDERVAYSYAAIAEAIMRPPGGYVAGEESALVQWINAGVSRPTFRPDKGIGLRIGKRPALVQNTETLAHIALIARRGPDAFRTRGRPEEPGTTLITLSGAVAHPGVIEIDRGASLRDIVSSSVPLETVGSLLVGGYGGTWLGPAHFSMPYASTSLLTIGAKAGVGIVVVLGASACGISESARIARFMASQSAGQCGPCIFGLPAIARDLSSLARGHGDIGLMARLRHRLDEVDGRGACRHPDGVVAMVRSALRVFGPDVAAHERREPCAHWCDDTVLRWPHGVGPEETESE